MAKTAAEILAELDKVLLRPATGSNPRIPSNYGDFAYSFNPKRSGGGTPAPSGKPLWQQLLGSLGGVGSTVTDTVYNNMSRANTQIGRWNDGRFNWKDDVWKTFGTLGNSLLQPVKETVVNPAKYQWQEWLHGDKGFGYDDIPILGTLNLMNEKNKHGSDILGLTGVKNEGLKRWGGLGLDIVADPLTYLTLGAGSAGKAGARAAAEVAAQQAARSGVQAVTKGKNVGRITDRTAEAIYDKIAGKGGTFANTPPKWAAKTRNGLKGDVARNAQGINQDLIERLASAKSLAARRAIENAGKAARSKASNALLNIDIPFTKMSAQIGTKPAFLMKNSPKIGQVGAVTAAELLSKLGAHTDTERAALLGKMGIEAKGLSDMNVQQMAHLQDQAAMAEDFMKRFVSNDGNVKNNLRNFKTADDVVGQNSYVNYRSFQASDLLDQLDPRIAERIAPFIEGLSGNVDQLRKLGPEGIRTFGGALGKLSGTIKGKTADTIRTGLDDAADKVADVSHTASIVDEPIYAQKITGEATKEGVNLPRKFDQFVQDAGGRSKLGDKLGKVGDHFSTRTLGVKGEGIVNQAAEKIRDSQGVVYAGLRGVDKQLSELQTMTKAFTDVEHKQVGYLLDGKFPEGYKRPISDKAKAVADKLRPILNQIAKAERTQGGFVKSADPELLTRAAGHTDDADFTALIENPNPSFAAIDNMIAKLDRSSRASGLTPEQVNAIQDKIDILSNMYNRNPVDAIGKRYVKAIRTKAMRDLQESLRKDGLIRGGKAMDNSPEAARVSDQFHKLTKSEAAMLGLEPNTRIHREVFDALKKTEQVFSDKGFQKFLNVAEDVTSIMRSLYTVYTPSHYWNNFVGNLFNNALAGVTRKSYGEAGKLLKAVKAGKATDEQQKIYQAALENGVLHQGYATEYLGVGIEREGKLANAAKWMYDNKLAKKIRNTLGDPADNFTRMALFVHGMNQTGSIKHAADGVRKYLFNYHEMTTTDRTVRVFVPFWNWMKNNIPLQINQLAQQPRFYETYQRLKNENQGDGSDMPGFALDSYFKIPGLGQARDPMLPLNDLNGILSGSLPETARTLAGSTNPFIKALFEIPANRNIYTGRTIDNDLQYGKGTDPQAWLKYGAGQLGKYGRSAYDAASGDSSWLDTLGNLVNPFGKPITLK